MSEFPLTAMEQRLKEHYLSRSDVQNRILSHQELSEYIAWLAKTEAGHRNETPPIDDPVFAEIAAQINKNPNNDKAVHFLASLFENQQEDRYLLAGNDISTNRMFRYMPAHWHTNSYFEIYYCYLGCCPVHLDSEVIILKPGSILILSPNIRHASPCYADDAVLNYCMLRSTTFDKVFWNQLPTNSLMSVFFRQALDRTNRSSYIQFETGRDQDLEEILGKIENEFALPGNYSSQYLNLLMSEFFLLMFRRYEGTAKLPRTENFFWRHEFSAIFSYIQAHFADSTQSDVAEEFGYSERQINRIVKNCTGDSYAHLALRLRMEKAASLLSSGADISAASAASGYSTLSSFYRAFTAYYSCTPAEYKNNGENN